MQDNGDWYTSGGLTLKGKYHVQGYPVYFYGMNEAGTAAHLLSMMVANRLGREMNGVYMVMNGNDTIAKEHIEMLFRQPECAPYGS